MDSREHFCQRFEALEQWTEHLQQHTRMVERRLRCVHWSIRLLVATLVVSALVSVRVGQAADFACAAGDVACLIDAINQANANGEANTITLEAGTYTLTTIDNTTREGPNGLPLLMGALTILGVGAGQTVIERAPEAPAFRLLEVAPSGVLTLQGLTLQGGEAEILWLRRGGGIRNDGTLTLHHSVIRDCTAWVGGGIDNHGTLWLSSTALEGNYADLAGAGLAALGPTRIEDSLILDNVAEVDSGIGFDPSASEVIVTRSIISSNIATLSAGGGLGGVGNLWLGQSLIEGNVAGIRGAGINLDNGMLTLHQSALIGNRAMHWGGGIYVEAGTVAVQQSLITQNAAVAFGQGGGIYNQGGTVTLQSSILAGNQADSSPDCVGDITVQRAFIGDPRGCTIQRQ
jgi:hypothetical protein